MFEIESNHQIIYFHPHNSMGVALNLMKFGFYQFNQISKIIKCDKYKELCNLCENDPRPNPKEAADFAFNNLIDCIKMTICFENYMKSILILNGYVIHKLDNIIFHELSGKQKNHPIKLSEVLEISEWQKNNKLKYQIKGISKNTIGMKELMSDGYQSILNLPTNILKSCKLANNYRNNLHLYNYEKISFSKKEYLELIEIIKFVNEKIVTTHNLIIDNNGLGQNYKLKKITYN